MLKAGSVPDKVLQLTLEGPIIPLINKEIISEYCLLTGTIFIWLNNKINDPCNKKTILV